jgi:hypothetical protein
MYSYQQANLFSSNRIIGGWHPYSFEYLKCIADHISSRTNKKEVVVCIHLCEDLPPPVVTEFLEFLAEKPELTRAGYVKLLDTRKTDSTMILVILPIYLASLLSGLL